MNNFAPDSRNTLEKNLLRVSFALFLILHIAALLSTSMFDKVTKPQEISIDIDLLPENTLSDSQPTTAAPKPVNILPQLPKKFAIRMPQPVPAEPDTEPVTASQPATEPKPAAAATSQPPKPANIKPPTGETLVKHAANEENVLRVQEALQRLALEKLRVQQRKEHKRTSTINTKMQKAIANLSNMKSSNALNASYQTALRIAIKRNFILPDIYDLKNANIKVKLEIRIDVRGNLLRLRLLKSSRNKIFDDLAMAAVRNTSPFPIPPAELVDKQIIVILTPLMTG